MLAISLSVMNIKMHNTNKCRFWLPATMSIKFEFTIFMLEPDLVYKMQKKIKSKSKTQTRTSLFVILNSINTMQTLRKFILHTCSTSTGSPQQ
jgi:hypothetical protein